MRIAYLFFAYKNPVLMRRTMDRLAFPGSAFFIHIDKKCDVKQFAALKGPNVFFTDVRLPVYWAEFSGVEAILLLVRQALLAPQAYDYLVLLSGSEYPLRSAKYIHDFIEARRGAEYMTIVKMPNEQAGKPISRINTLRLPSTQPIFRLVTRALAKAGLAQRDYRKHLGNLAPYSGLTWWALTRDACQHILEFKERNPGVARFYENTFAPEETFFHTALGNSPFLGRMRRNLLFEDWSGGGARPAMINEKHVAFFEAQDEVQVQDLNGPGELLFARKLSDENPQILDRIDRMIERKDAAKPSGILQTI